ncbi:MAG: helicase [Myxococcales bacterium]
MTGPLIVQGDLTLLLEVDHPGHEDARNDICRFAELVKSPEHMHTWRVTPLSIWNAAAGGVPAGEMVDALTRHSRYPLPHHVKDEILSIAARFGRVVLTVSDGELRLEADTPELAEELWLRDELREHLEFVSHRTFRATLLARGALKQALIRARFPAVDLAGYTPGEPLSIQARAQTLAGLPFSLRPYQQEAVDVYHASGAAHGGSGVIVLPCGAGKTIVGIAAMQRVGASTLILTTSGTAVRQWIDELLDKTHLTPDQIGEYTGQAKEVRPVTVSTYQILTHRKRKGDDFTHFGLFRQRDFGLIVYDEVHLLPAPVFRVTAEVQARRRLGLTATLVREDGLEGDVFALIGPKKLDIPWKTMERQGWIARATCSEVRVPMAPELGRQYAAAPERLRFRVASENPRKLPVVSALLARHPDAQALIIGTYVDQLQAVAHALRAPLLTGDTPQRKRAELYDAFREGREQRLVVSKVANFAIDLPDASLAIQISGTFGSRQEEAQRLGRLLRPKKGENQAHFYSLVSRDTVEQDLAHHRQLFLVEQGYDYRIEDARP